MDELALPDHPPLFRRGVSDPALRHAMERIGEYLRDPRTILLDDRMWTEGFSGLFESLAAGLDGAQRAGLEIAVDTLLIDAGLPSWTVSQAVRRLGSPPVAA